MLGSDPEIEVVGVAADGRQALVVIADTDPDVVLMDLRMPGGGGAESIRALRERDRTRDRKSTRLNSSHVAISYAVFCLKKKKNRHDASREGAVVERGGWSGGWCDGMS